MSRIIADTTGTYPKYIWAGTDVVLMATDELSYSAIPQPLVSDGYQSSSLSNYMVTIYNQQFKTAITEVPQLQI